MSAPDDATLEAWAKGLGSKAWGVREMEDAAGYEITDDDGDLVVAECWHREIADAIAALPELVAEVVRLRAVAQDWLDVMEADEADCTCSDGDPCPLCRCRAALSVLEATP